MGDGHFITPTELGLHAWVGVLAVVMTDYK
jgi:hypothetical protein